MTIVIFVYRLVGLVNRTLERNRDIDSFMYPTYVYMYVRMWFACTLAQYEI